jgi:hypothetical protein
MKSFTLVVLLTTAATAAYAGTGQATKPAQSAPSAAASAPAAAAPLPYDKATPIQGEVLETIDTETYSYIRLKTEDGEVWAATMKMSIPKGTKLVIHDAMLMTDFYSKGLQRKFDRIYFGSAVDTAESQAASPAAAHMAAHAQMVQAQDVPVGKIAKATGAEARTVAEVYAQRTKLQGKNVAVRGKVVKTSDKILDRNWIHVRDGSGTAKDATNDLLVTTKESVKVGDVLVVRGVVRTNADYGSGYAYPVVLEGATFSK